MARGGHYAAGTSSSAVASGYDLDDDNTINTTPVAHFDASAMNGTDNTGWSDEDCVSLTSLPNGIYFDTSGSVQWKDRTGNYAAGYNGGATKVPKFDDGTDNDPGEAGPAGFPAVFFDGDDDSAFLRDADGSGAVDITLPVADPSGSDTGWHIFTAFRCHQTSSHSNRFLDGGSSTSYCGTSNTYFLQCKMAGSLVNFLLPLADYGDLSLKPSWVEWRCYDDGGTAKSSCRFQYEGAAVTECRDDHASYDNPSTTVGDYVVSEIGNNGGAPSDFIYEIILFGSALSSDDRATVVDYLQNKYSI